MHRSCEGIQSLAAAECDGVLLPSRAARMRPKLRIYKAAQPPFGSLAPSPQRRLMHAAFPTGIS
jgi:hypothetical protein